MLLNPYRVAGPKLGRMATEPLPSLGPLTLSAGKKSEWLMGTDVSGTHMANGYISRAFSEVPKHSTRGKNQKWLLSPSYLEGPKLSKMAA